ncbi:DUF1707 SHOCT-like domain-containing protein [Kribbella monticola]|uniref:DUF1707 SHOCT-like domain-containing protein n=1 Tax=Kribbella monticola TaxID=2185285 RepID=UPI000DD2CB73|nr:DUF1707 domain-containing protein [Kribbella monticola]
MVSAPSDPGSPAEQPRPELRASDADRERVADVLRDALVEGRLQLTEFEARLEEAHAARTHGELEQVVHDLPAPSPVGATVSQPGRIGGTPTSRTGIGIFGAFDRKGVWTIARRFTSVAIMGGGRIDLREARFEAAETVIRAFAVMGGVKVVVPPDVALEVRGIGVMGGFDHSKSGTGPPDGPRVVVTGFAFWGGVSVERKVTKAERKRLKAERKERKQLDAEE